MKRLSEIPEHWFVAMRPNLDDVFDVPFKLTEGDISWMGLNRLVNLLKNAEVAATNAVSWREKFVGAAALAIDREKGCIAVLTGFNFKPEKGDGGFNVHAEQFAIERIRRKGFKHITALAVWGEPEKGEDDNDTPLSLYPCRLCTDFMRNSPEIDSSTAIISGAEDLKKCELYGFNDLTNYYETGEKTNFQRLNLSDGVLQKDEYDEAFMFQLLNTWTRLNPDASYAGHIREWFDAGQPTATS